jgi:hypothetical protein
MSKSKFISYPVYNNWYEITPESILAHPLKAKYAMTLNYITDHYTHYAEDIEKNKHWQRNILYLWAAYSLQDIKKRASEHTALIMAEDKKIEDLIRAEVRKTFVEYYESGIAFVDYLSRMTEQHTQNTQESKTKLDALYMQYFETIKDLIDLREETIQITKLPRVSRLLIDRLLEYQKTVTKAEIELEDDGIAADEIHQRQYSKTYSA